MRLFVQVKDPSLHLIAQQIAAEIDVPLSLDEIAMPDMDYCLQLSHEGLSLCQPGEKNSGLVRVDFESGAANHRRLYGGGKGQQIAKAVGVKAGVVPTVLDCTAGLGRDAFVLASLGCQVSMIERHNVVHVLLRDGLERAAASADAELRNIILRMKLMAEDSLSLLNDEPAGGDADNYDVIYLDPMFPARSKSALVKKEMRFFHDLVGNDADADQLLGLALERAKHRVVVKRSGKAENLAGQTPSYSLGGKSSRFDIYALRAFNT